MANLMQITLNYDVTTSGWRSKSAVVPRGMNFHELSTAMRSEDGVCEFDPMIERATRGWCSDASLELRAGWAYHINPAPEVREALEEMPHHFYLDGTTFR